MANCCDNKLVATGPKEDIARFKEKAVDVYPNDAEQQRHVLSFHSFLPVPTEVLMAGDREAKRCWEEENWGCQYGAAGAELRCDEEGSLTYAFESKWGPPVEFLRRIGPQWPSLTFDLTSSELQGGYADFVRIKDSSVESHQLRTWCRGDLYTSTRPGYPAKNVKEVELEKWCARLYGLGVKTVLCLLNQEHLAYYATVPGGLLGQYNRAGFKVVHRPIADHLMPAVPDELLAGIYCDFKAAQKPILLHCSAGKDRTGAVVDYITIRIEREHTLHQTHENQ